MYFTCLQIRHDDENKTKHLVMQLYNIMKTSYCYEFIFSESSDIT